MATIEAVRDRNQAPILIHRDDAQQQHATEGTVHGKNPTDGGSPQVATESLRQATELDGGRNKVANVQQQADAFAKNEQHDKADRIGTPGRGNAASGQQGYYISPLERLRQMREQAGDDASPKVPGWA